MCIYIEPHICGIGFGCDIKILWCFERNILRFYQQCIGKISVFHLLYIISSSTKNKLVKMLINTSPEAINDCSETYLAYLSGRN